MSDKSNKPADVAGPEVTEADALCAAKVWIADNSKQGREIIAAHRQAAVAAACEPLRAENERMQELVRRFGEAANNEVAQLQTDLAKAQASIKTLSDDNFARFNEAEKLKAALHSEREAAGKVVEALETTLEHIRDGCAHHLLAGVVFSDKKVVSLKFTTAEQVLESALGAYHSRGASTDKGNQP